MSAGHSHRLTSGGKAVAKEFSTLVQSPPLPFALGIENEFPGLGVEPLCSLLESCPVRRQAEDIEHQTLFSGKGWRDENAVRQCLGYRQTEVRCYSPLEDISGSSDPKCCLNEIQVFVHR